MKKIVALVLAMVMVLGLATTAFAAADFEGKGYNFYAVEDGVVATDTDYSEYTMSFEGKKGDYEDGEYDVYELTVWARVNKPAAIEVVGIDVDDLEVKGDDEDLNAEFVLVPSKVNADLQLIKGKEILYFALVEDYEDGFQEEATEKVYGYSVPGKFECDTTYATSPLKAGTYYKWDGITWKEVDADDAVKFFYVDGLAVAAAPAEVLDLSVRVNMANEVLDVETYDDDYDLVYTGHVYMFDSKGNTYTEANLTKVYCDVCGEDFKYVVGPKEVADQAFGEFNYDQAGIWGVAPVWVELDATPAAGTGTGSADADNTVESPKTFDAGIAMYVGMSVMAAAGSAVVLKKKD